MLHKKSLSVVLLTKDNAELLSDCLASVSWADEIIVLDSGSVDQTCDIAAQANARVFHTKDWLGFGIQRQRAQAYATGEYIFMIDTDERVTLRLQKAILEVLEQSNHKVVYSCARHNLFLGHFMRYSGWYPDRVVRLYAREHYFYNSLPVHESLEIGNANIIKLMGDLQHLTCRDLSTFQHKQLSYAKIWALERYRQGYKCSIFTIIRHTCGAFLNTLFLRFGFLDGKYGWLLAVVNSQYTFNKYTILWAFR